MCPQRRYDPGMDEHFFAETSAWLTQAGLAGTPENEIFSVFCDRCLAAGIPVGRAHSFIDTLDPVYEGRLFRWGYSPDESGVVQYGRTTLDRLGPSGSASLDEQATYVWRRSAHYAMLQNGVSLLRRRLDAGTKDEFSLLLDWRAAGMTDYVAIISRFAEGASSARWTGFTRHGRRGRLAGSATGRSQRSSAWCLTSRWLSSRWRSLA
jgi:adenylate cyclase